MPRVTKGRLPIGKWKKYHLLCHDHLLKNHLPATARYQTTQISTWLRRFACIVIKPDTGEGGIYVVKVCSSGNRWLIHDGKTVWSVQNSPSAYRHLPRFTREQACVIQQYIPLMTLHDCPVDIRVIVQRSGHGHFEVTGTFRKVAPHGTFVTNVKQGGVVGPIRPYLLQIAKGDKRRTASLENELNTLSLRIANILQRSSTNTIYGIDFGLDSSNHIWIIEVNTKPSLLILDEIDHEMYLRASRLYAWNRSKLLTLQEQDAT